tara:strand:+ start:202 stop:1176 length:975 start_codon:yes stop_codon:yes gene_type:complete
VKWIGQHIYDLISRFRNDVYLEDVSTGTIASGGNLGLDSNNKIVKATVSSGSGDITGVDLTGTLPITIGSETNTTSGDYSSTIGINIGNGINVVSGDLVTNDSEIDHDSLDNFSADEHYTQANITTVGTIGTGVWQGTAIAQAYIAGDAINGDKIADDAVDSEHYTDGSIDTAHIADDQVTFAKAVGVTPNIYGSIIKVLPSDFMANEEPGVTKTLQFVDNDASGIKPGDNNTELLAFVSIPETMKATHVDVYADDTLAFSVYELNIHESVGDISAASKGTGNCNTTLDITDVNATATNYLLIQVITVSKADRVFGAKVTIAAQ